MKTMKSYRLSDSAIGALDYLKTRYEVTETDIIEQVILYTAIKLNQLEEEEKENDIIKALDLNLLGKGLQKIEK